MKKGETIPEMSTRFTALLNTIYSFGELIPTEKVVRKLLIMLPKSWKLMSLCEI